MLNKRKGNFQHDDSYPSSVSDAGLEGLEVGELKGVPESVSRELSR